MWIRAVLTHHTAYLMAAPGVLPILAMLSQVELVQDTICCEKGWAEAHQCVSCLCWCKGGRAGLMCMSVGIVSTGSGGCTPISRLL